MSESTHQLANGQSYLGRSFDSYQNMMQITACLREAARQRAIAQPLVLELSRRETGLRDYFPEASITRYPTHEKNIPTLTSPIALPFAGSSFHFCLVTDAYEHTPAGLRQELLGEMLRVTDGLVLIGTPQGNEIVNRFDRIVFDFIWGKYAERFEPLEQHIEFGLEPLERTLESLKAIGAEKVLALPCNYVYRWIHQILIFFDLQYKHSHWDVFEPLNRVYNERLAPYDYKEPCYRYLIAAVNNQEINLETLTNKLRAPAETPAHVAHMDGVLVETFRSIEASLADRLRLCSQQGDLLRRDNEWALGEIKHLNSIVEKLRQDNQWALDEIKHLSSVGENLRNDNEWAGKEIERLNSIIQQLQQDNRWAAQEIEHLNSVIAAMHDQVVE